MTFSSNNRQNGLNSKQRPWKTAFDPPDRQTFRLAGGILALTGGFLVCLYFDLFKYMSWDAFTRNRDFLEELAGRHFILSKAVYTLVYFITAGLSLPSAAILTLAGGALFGLFWGTALVSLASTAGAAVSFLITRFFLRDFFKEKFQKSLKKVLTRFEKEGSRYLLSLRLAPVMPFFLTNILMGLTDMKTRTFIFVSWAGMLPATLIYVNAGRRLSRMETPGDLISFPVLISLFLIALLPLSAKKLYRLRLNFEARR